MRKLIVLGTVLALVLALELQAHTPPVWIDLPQPVPTAVMDGTLDGMAASSTYWRNYFLYDPHALSQFKNDGFSTYSVRYDGMDALLGMLDSEQIEKDADACGDLSLGTRMNRYSLWVTPEAAFVDTTYRGCEPCLTNPNGAGCEDCLLPPVGYVVGWGYLERGTLDVRLYLINGGDPIDELPNLVIRYSYIQYDYATCAGLHTHKPGLWLHIGKERHRVEKRAGENSPWYLMSALRSGTVTPPADPPADPPATVTPSVDPAVLQARVDSLNALLGAQADSLQILAARLATTDTLHYCPQTANDLNNLFEAFTGLADSTDAAGAGKAVSSVQLRSWGAIKALIAVED